MRGLLLKEWYMLSKNFKSLFLIIFLFAVFGLFYDVSLVTIVPVLLASVPVSTTALDERSGWSGYADALPVTRKNIVDSKYISGAVCILFSAALFALVTAARNGIGASVRQMIFQTALGIIYMSLIMPAVFRFGTEKARYINMAVVAVFAMLAVIIMTTVAGSFSEIPMHFAVPALPAALALMLVSERVSVSIYKRKEF